MRIRSSAIWYTMVVIASVGSLHYGVKAFKPLISPPEKPAPMNEAVFDEGGNLIKITEDGKIIYEQQLQ